MGEGPLSSGDQFGGNLEILTNEQLRQLLAASKNARDKTNPHVSICRDNAAARVCVAATAANGQIKLSRELSDQAKAAAVSSGRGIAHDQAALNFAADNAEFYLNQGSVSAAGPSLANYQNIQGGAPATNIFNTPYASVNETVAPFAKAVGEEAVKQAAEQAVAEGAAKALGLVGAPAIRFVKRWLKERAAAKAVAKVAEGEPVSVANGEYLETWRDYLIPGALPFDGARYMGLKLEDAEGWRGPLGPCQISAFDEYFDNFAPGKLAFHQADGKRIEFDRPFNFLPAENAAYPHLKLFAPWLKRLKLKDRRIVKYFRQYADGFYRLEKIETLNGDWAEFKRDLHGVLLEIARDDGLQLVFGNDARWRRTSVDLMGHGGARLHLARYAYDEQGRMSRADCVYGMSVAYRWRSDANLLESWNNQTQRSRTTFAYDAQGRVVHTQTTGLWDNDRFAYDDARRVTTYLPAGEAARAQQFEYDEHENVTAEIDALGGATRHAFNANGFKTSTTDAEGAAMSMQYDIHGNVKALRDAEGRETIYSWGSEGQLDIVIDPAGNVRKNEYDERANVVVEIDAERHRTEHWRDERGRLLTTRFADGAEEHRAYDAHGWLESIRDARGGVTRFSYDAFGRLISVTDALGGETTYAYQAGAGGFATPTSLTRPDGVTISRGFDAEGALAEVTDGEGRRWAYNYGAFDVLQEIVDPKGGRLRLSYDSEGRLTEVVNAVYARYLLERDVAGRIVREVDFDGREAHYKRDKVGRVVEKLKPDGAKLTYAYDKSGLVTAIESFGLDGDEEDVTSFAYDRRGLLVEAKNKAARVEFIRDRNGRVVEEDINGRRIKSRYDARGRRIERRIFTGLDRPEATRLGEHLTAYGYDPLGAVERIVIGRSQLKFSHDALGRETRRIGGAGFALTQEYDPVGQLKEQAFGARTSSPHRRRFAFDRAGSPVGIDDTIWGASAYVQDANGQTVEASHGVVARGVETGEDRWWRGAGDAQERERFDYDAARNIFASGGGPAWLTSVGGVVSAARGPQGERITLTHDACGRVVERRVGRDGFRPKHWSYGWDAFDRLIWCETPDGAHWRYAYDPFGRREEKRRRLSPPGQPLRVEGSAFTWDGDLCVEEIPLKENGSLDYAARIDWHYLPGTFAPLAKVCGGKVSYVVTDHLGTPREMLSEKGEVEWAASYRLWGSVRALRAKRRVNGGFAEEPEDEDAEACPLRFPGQWADAETGLYYNRHRHYDPLVGQYVSPDPIGLAGGSRPQGYVDNPGAWLDPLGLASQFAKGQADLAKMRSELGLPPAGSAADKSTLAKLEIDGKEFYGVNAHGQPVTLKVNAISKTHAETDVFQQAKNVGTSSKKATLYVDRDLCDACGANGAVKSMARQLGISELTVVSPSGVSTITP